MRHYILDTGFFINAREYYNDVFPSFWKKMEEAVQKQLIYSVSEVKNEIEKYGGKQEHLLNWTNRYKNIFTRPDEKEQLHLNSIFKIEKFQKAGNKKILNGGFWADPFIIAKAMEIKGIVVTREKPSNRDIKGKMQGSLKIPDICQHFSVPCISPEEFMTAQHWKF